ncbi:hypothetical protein M0Q28_05350 [Patescibacteria group bacterium]|jgi:hypothetical protein|nr:hypothetical protein [Patescibacteria group bacterium]
MSVSPLRLRALAFADAIGYAPTEAELATWSEPGEITPPLNVYRGRVIFQGREELVEEHERRELFFPRKIRRARRVARFLARLPGVRFVAVTQTTALAHARDEGDLDMFVITRRGSLALARALATVWYALTGARPGARKSERDAVCLSFFIDDSALDLSKLMLPGDDPYFRYWFLSLLPLYDDGVSSELWAANNRILSHHPHARRWMMNPGLRVRRPAGRLPRFAFLDALVRRLQDRAMSKGLRELANKDTRVVITPHVLKFHADDGRERFREAYYQTCKRYGLDT